jgi:ankyrin repeat protein
LKVSPKILPYDTLTLTDEQGKNVLHHAVIKQHHEIVKQLVFLDSDSSKLRNCKDTKGRTPMMYDDKANFKDVFVTIWDSAKAGNVERLTQLGSKMDETTAWTKNTPLHIAVKNIQIKAVKTLVWDLKANTKALNANESTPIDFCNKFIKDESTHSTMMGLLTKSTKNIKVVKNLDAKRLKDEKKKAEDAEIQKLKSTIRTAIEKKNYDLKQMFKLFDTNGDGTFD